MKDSIKKIDEELEKKTKAGWTKEQEVMEKLRIEAEELELKEHGRDTYEETVEMIQEYSKGLTPRSIEEFSESHDHGEEEEHE